jgi:uncharacterized Fe-S radical SAM superfamily protein PflX
MYGTRVTILRVGHLWFVMLLYHPSYSIFHKYPEKRRRKKKKRSEAERHTAHTYGLTINF